MHTAMATAKEVPYKCTCTRGANTGFNCTLHDQCLWFQSEIEDFFISTRYTGSSNPIYCHARSTRADELLMSTVFAKVTTSHRKSVQRETIHILRELHLDASAVRIGALECGSCGVLDE